MKVGGQVNPPSLLRDGSVPAPMPESPGSELQRWVSGD